MKVAIHQPNYFPWIGFFNKVSMADTLVILDSVQFERDGYTNRNKIKLPDSQKGWTWLTVPVGKGSSQKSILDVEIDNSQRWNDASLSAISRNYKSSPHLKEYSQLIDGIYEQDWDNLCDMNIFIMRELFDVLGLKPRIIRSSELDIKSKKGDLILDICKEVGGTEYISGISGKKYMDMARAEEYGIKVTYQDFKHPVYDQVRNPHISTRRSSPTCRSSTCSCPAGR